LNFSLINGCGTHENIFVVIPSFEMVLESTNIIIVTKKSKKEKKNKYKEKFYYQ